VSSAAPAKRCRGPVYQRLAWGAQHQAITEQHLLVVVGVVAIILKVVAVDKSVVTMLV